MYLYYGLRTQRTDGTITYNYVYNGSQLTAMTVGENTLYFSYDAAGVPMSVNFNSTEYFYTSNIQGDVTGIVNAEGTTVVAYTYDAWGKLLNCTGSMASTLGTLNPLRYRGYVYDQEIGYYYLQSRYYNPEIGRFINADGLVSTSRGLLGYNMFAYCGNNPVVRIDPRGNCYYNSKGEWCHDNWEFIGDYERKPDPQAIDITEQLNKEMIRDAEELYTTVKHFGYAAAAYEFAINSKSGGIWDLKSQND